MTDIELKALFGRFRDLNLIVLVEDLRRGIVAMGRWDICPIQHGLPRFCGSMDQGYIWAEHPLEMLRNPLVSAFIYEWDEATISNADLLRVCRELLAERQADADAMQALIHEQMEPVCA